MIGNSKEAKLLMTTASQALADLKWYQQAAENRDNRAIFVHKNTILLSFYALVHKT